MKKVVLSFITLLLVVALIPMVSVAAENKVKVYVFSKEGCTACESAFEYFNGLLEDNPDMFELVTYETFTGSWGIKNSDYYDILIATLEHFGEDTEKIATPIIVVGDYIQIGIDNISAFEDRINNFKTSKNYKDVVASLQVEDNTKYDGLIVAGIFVVVIGLGIFFIKMSKK